MTAAQISISSWGVLQQLLTTCSAIFSVLPAAARIVHHVVVSAGIARMSKVNPHA